MINAVRSGAAIVNDTNTHLLNPACPFGGVGESGMGAYRGKFSLEAFAYKRCIMHRNDQSALDLPIRYPPYSKFGLSIAKFAVALPNLPHITLTSVGVFFALVAAATYGAFIYKN